MSYDPAQQMFFLLVYGALAWVAEAVWFAVKERKFVDCGLLTLPINFELGLVFSNIAVVLPTLGNNIIGMYLLTFANLVITHAVLGFFSGWLTKNAYWLAAPPSGTWQGFLLSGLSAAGVLLIYLLFQPLLLFLVELIPPLVLDVLCIVASALILIDFVTVLVAVKKGRASYERTVQQSGINAFAARIARFVWQRLEKAYPGISDEKKRSEIVFAHGMSLDKIVWVFLISSFCGDLVETIYCRLTAGRWMYRSSVVFGPFSFVWGLGVVLLTVSLMRFKDKNDRWIMLAGGILGGAFEYTCSVFTEIVFGKVFWTYEHMPFNIGGRTNLLFMFFWGIISLVWIKLLYPPLDSFIERFPPVAATVVTWVTIILMTLNGLLTVSVLRRYDERKTEPAPSGMLEQLIDNIYDDDFVRNRWPNMIDTSGT